VQGKEQVGREKSVHNYLLSMYNGPGIIVALRNVANMTTLCPFSYMDSLGQDRQLRSKLLLDEVN
jgi:hypothetical protein